MTFNNTVKERTKPLLIIILGPACTGKSTLAKEIGKQYNLPVLGKDDIKEFLFDTLGSKDRAWSQKLGVASIGLLYLFIEKFLESGKSFVVESTFKEEDTKKFLELKKDSILNRFKLIVCATVRYCLRGSKTGPNQAKDIPGMWIT